MLDKQAGDLSHPSEAESLLAVSRSPENPQGQGGIPAQILNGLNLALGSVRLDPFDQFPVRLTSQHHKLLHHCESVLVGRVCSHRPSHIAVPASIERLE